jgi:shikimate kinase
MSFTTVPNSATGEYIMKSSVEMVNIEYQVEDAKKQAVHVAGADKDILIGGRDSGNIFIFALNDELRKSIAEKIANKLGKELVIIRRGDGNPAIIEAAEKNNQVVSLPRGAALSEKNRNMLKDNGKVLYIMSDFMTLLNATDRSEDAREQISLMFNRFEPSFMNAAHHIVLSDQSDDEILQDALEKISV